MARWLVQLEGDALDLEEYPHWFPTGDVFSVAAGDEVFLAGEAFGVLQEAGQVRERALQAVDEFSAIIAILWPSLQRPKVGTVFREADDGSRAGHVFLSASVRGRSKVRATLFVAGTPQEDPGATQGQVLLEGSRSDPHLRMATLIWADEIRTWPRLYRVLEEVERFLREPANKAGLCSGNERDRFTRSANAAEIAGKDARHASGKYEPPSRPMSLDEATSFVRSLLEASLRQAAGRQALGAV
jgi:hypothetical protein